MTRTVTKLLQETYTALELAARDVMQTRNMTFARLEDTDPKMIKPLFEAAITITETPKAVAP